jgi:hypothetical protein
MDDWHKLKENNYFFPPKKNLKKIPDSLIGMKIKIRSGMCPAIDVCSQVSR